MQGHETVTSLERNWAAIAHASTLLSIVAGLGSGGLGSLLLVLIPLGIYLAFRERSRFVAFHALQATTLQLGGLTFYALGLIVLIVATVIAWVVTGLLSVVLVGLLLIPLALAVTLLLLLFLLLFPLAVMGYALFAAVETGRGVDFHCVWIGEWLEGIAPSWYPAGGE
jgi:uncharacterized Tic20 family protein